MPDVHAGKGCTIGTTMTITDKIVPNLVGVDIGCGMETVELKAKRINLPELDSFIHKNIPCGFEIRSAAHKYIANTRLEELYCKEAVSMPRAECSLGTLGGGNHFIEVDQGRGRHTVSGSAFPAAEMPAYRWQSTIRTRRMLC